MSGSIPQSDIDAVLSKKKDHTTDYAACCVVFSLILLEDILKIIVTIQPPLQSLQSTRRIRVRMCFAAVSSCRLVIRPFFRASRMRSGKPQAIFTSLPAAHSL